MPVLFEYNPTPTEKLGFELDRWEEVEELLLALTAEMVAPDTPPEAVTGDPDDDLILGCAIQAKVDVLVSGDRRHLLPVGEHRGVQVITPQAFLADLRRG